MTRFDAAFGALVLAQAAHSVEEYLGRLWESFPPARWLTGLLPMEPTPAFLVINLALVAFGVWCVFWPVRRRWPIAVTLAWIWIVIQLINGVGHPLWALSRRGYEPGTGTAPLLLILALNLAFETRRLERTGTPA